MSQRSPWTKPSIWMCAALLACAAGCGDERGAEGESCGARSDCEDGLSCIALVCVAESDAKGARDTGDTGDTGDAGVGSAAAVGSSCRGRADCAAGASCVSNRCVATSMGVSTDWRFGGRGESCAAANDCAEGLSCIGGVCRDATVNLSHTGKECARVECDADADCCEAFVPNVGCEMYQASCETDPIFCNTYRSLCVCNRSCVDQLCVAAAPGCSQDAECMSQQTPYCVDERCVQCDDDSSCPGVGSRCVGGACLAPCTVDENCPLLHACEDGECVDVGCRSDRECVFLEGDPLAVCRDGECDVPCTRDSECAEDGARFQVCVEGSCTFVGCESDAECRALLSIENSPSDTRAVCR